MSIRRFQIFIGWPWTSIFYRF